MSGCCNMSQNVHTLYQRSVMVAGVWSGKGEDSVSFRSREEERGDP